MHVINLQRMGFICANDIQNRYARMHLDELAGRKGTKGLNVLLLVEHNPVYTVGLRDVSYSNKDEEKLKALGAEFHRTNRGGLITFHGPGQLVAYPVLNLKYFKLGMRDYVCNLEKTMVKTCKFFGLDAKTTGDTGCWVNDKKIGSIGVHGSRFVTTHGISLNCNNDLSWFQHIVPCGLEGKEVTSITEEFGKIVSINDTIPFFLDAFKEKFDCDIEEEFLKINELSLLPTEENMKLIRAEKLM